MLIQTEDKEYSRDIYTMALTKTNVNELQKYKEYTKRMRQMQSLSDDVDQLKNQMSEIKELLTRLVQNNG